MYGELLERIAGDIDGDGVFGEVLAGHQDVPVSSAFALRVAGGLHRLVLDGTAPRLAGYYPSVGGTWSAAAWPEVTAAAREHAGQLVAALDAVPQTNEVGRSAALIGGLLLAVDQFRYPVRLFEIGASAGLNLRADRFRYSYDGGEWGPPSSPVIIEDAWQGARPPGVQLRITERRGFDIAPVDATATDGERRLLSYVWPDMTARLDRLRAAIRVAREVPAEVDRMSAVDAVAGLRLVRGTLTVLWHSITWQYLSSDEQDAVAAGVASLAAVADPTTPFAWLCLEPMRRGPSGRMEFVVRIRCWPDGTDRIVGVCSPHGPPVIWS